MPPTCSPCRSSATSTPGSATRRSPRSRSGWPAWRAVSVRSPRRAGSRRSSSSSAPCARPATMSCLGPVVRRHAHPARGHTRPLRRRDHVRADERPCRLRRSSAAGDQGDLHRGRRQPVGSGRRSRCSRRRRPCRRRSTGRRLDRRDPYLCRPIDVRRRHRRPLGDQVPRRPRHVARRRRRRVRPVRLGQRQLPADDRAGPVLRRAVVVGQLRRVRVLHPLARRAAPRRRRDALAVQRLPADAGCRDTAAAHGRPPRQRPRSSPTSSRATRRCRGCAGPGCPTTRITSGPHATCRPARGRVLLRRARRSRRRAPFIESVELCSHLANIGDTRTFVIHPGRPRTGSCPTSALAAAGVPPTWSASRSGSRTPTTSCGTSTRHWRRRPRRLVSDPTAQERLEILRATRTVAIIGMSSDPSRAELLRGHLPPVVELLVRAVWFVNPKGGEALGQPVYPSLAELPGVPDLVDVFRRPTICPTSPRRSSPSPVSARSGPSSACAPSGPRGSPPPPAHRRDGPLPEDRARPLRRRPAHGWLRHRRHLLPPPPHRLRSRAATTISGCLR